MFRGHVRFRGCWWEEILSKKRHPDAGAGVLSSSNGRVRRAVVSLQKGIFFTSKCVFSHHCNQLARLWDHFNGCGWECREPSQNDLYSQFDHDRNWKHPFFRILLAQIIPNAVQIPDTVDGSEILHHLGYMKPCNECEKLHINWCKISEPSTVLPFLLGGFNPYEKLGGGFKYFLFSPLLGDDSHFD